MNLNYPGSCELEARSSNAQLFLLTYIFLITYPRLYINLPRASAFLGTAPIYPLQKPRFRRERVPVPVDFDRARGRCLTSGNVNEVQ